MGIKKRKYIEPPMAVSHPQEPPMAVSHTQSKDGIPNIEAEEKKRVFNFPAPEVQDWAMRKILEHEGFRLNPYKDTEGHITGGIGHKFTREDFQNFRPEWPTEKKYEYWMERFKEDYARASRAAIKIMLKHGIEPNETIQYVLTDMVFNMGPLAVGGGINRKGENVKGFKNFLADLREGNIEGAILEMKRKNKKSEEPSKWYSQVPNRVESLIKILRSEA